MRVSCLQENLAKGLSIVGRAVSTRSTLPVLGNILIEAKDGELRLAATNLEIGINCWIGAKIEDEGAITVPARLLGGVCQQPAAGDDRDGAGRAHADAAPALRPLRSQHEGHRRRRLSHHSVTAGGSHEIEENDRIPRRHAHGTPPGRAAQDDRPGRLCRLGRREPAHPDRRRGHLLAGATHHGRDRRLPPQRAQRRPGRARGQGDDDRHRAVPQPVANWRASARTRTRNGPCR